MQSSTDKTSKVNLQSKLRLKRDNNDSSQNTVNLNIKDSSEKSNSNQENRSNEKSSHKENRSCLPVAEDSLADFKSPKEETRHKPIFSKFKIDADKVKKKILKPKTKTSLKTRKSTATFNQPSIESTFFKPQISVQNEIKESVPCPLCLKPFKDDITCTTHMKTCASKNQVSLQQLLDAKQLRDRQAEERKAMGLPVAPVLPEKKKCFRSKNFSTGDDPQLQLVLAMSESLYEAEQMQELEQAALLAGIPLQCIKEMNDEERRTTLKTFGFTTNKPVADIPTTRSKRKKLLGPTILQTRSKDDKDRVLTERIACILTGDDALTQAQQNTDIVTQKNKITVLRSKVLKEIEKSDNRLWDKSKLTKKYYDFYVEDLKSKLLQANQQKTELSNSNDLPEKINDDNKENDLSNTSVLYEPMDIDVFINQNKDKDNCDVSSINSIDCDIELENMSCDFEKNVIHNWRDTLNNSAASDIIIFVKNNKHVYAHKLVFYVQCPNILLDIKPNEDENLFRIKEKICWLDKDQLSMLAFLEFIYCGSIDEYVSIFDHSDLLSEVNKLAKSYKVSQLFTYLRNRQKEVRHNKLKDSKSFESQHQNNKIVDQSSINNSMQQCNSPNIRKSLSFEMQSIQCTSSIPRFRSDPTPVTNEPLTKSFVNRRITASPDLFESDNEEESIYLRKTQENNQPEGSENTMNSNALEELDEVELHQIKKKLEREIVNLSRGLSPQIDRSSAHSPQQDIHEAVTPKHVRSPEIYDQPTQEEKCNDKNEMYHVVTPVSSPIRLGNYTTPEKESSDKNETFDAAALESNQSVKLEECTTPEKESTNRNEIFNAVTPESNPSERLKECITPRKPVYASMDIDSTNIEEIVEKDDDSMYTAVTPSRADKLENEEIERKYNKIKSSISLFIEKVCRENAKGALDSDSETDTSTVKDVNVKFRNPFLKRNRDDSYAYLRNDGQQDQPRYKRTISLLEEDVLRDKKKPAAENIKTLDNNDETQNLLTNKFLTQRNNLNDKDSSKINISENSQTSSSKSQNFVKPYSVTEKAHNKSTTETVFNLTNSDDEIQDITVDESEMSMYSRYKKLNNHDNSIAKYRAQLNFNSRESLSAQEIFDKTNNHNLNNTSSSVPKQNLFKKSNAKENNAVIEDITLVSDSDSEEQISVSSVSNPKNTSYKNSSITEKQDKDIDTRISDIQDDSTFPLELVDDQLEQFRSSKVISSTVLKENAKTKLIDLALDSDEDIYNDSTFPYNLAMESDNSLKKKKCNRDNLPEKEKQKEYFETSEKKNDEVDAEINKILQSNPELDDKDDKVFEHCKKKSSDSKIHSNQDEINLSPISIISSPEMAVSDVNKKKIIEFDSLENECFDEIEFDDNWITKSSKVINDKSPKRLSEIVSDINISKKQLAVEDTSSKGKTFPKPSTSKNLTRPSPPSSPVLSQSRRDSRISDIKSPKVNKSSRRRSESPEQLSQKTRKMKIKSVSASDFRERKKDCDQNNVSMTQFTTPKSKNKSTRNSVGYREDMTPPMDYSVLETPQLHQELKRFGLKPQSREKAKLLLRHIYKETHLETPTLPKRTSSNNSSSEDEEPPLKKRNTKSTRDKDVTKRKNEVEAAQNSEDCFTIAEEMGYDEPDAGTLDNPVSIKDVFLRILDTNKDLYTKVLTYEPLPLEPLHLLLKQKGYKFKLNSIMDFLDEQCITFQVQTGKGNRTKKTK